MIKLNIYDAKKALEAWQFHYMGTSNVKRIVSVKQDEVCDECWTVVYEKDNGDTVLTEIFKVNGKLIVDFVH